MKPALFLTNHLPADRHAAFEALAELVPLELVLFGGPSRHGAPDAELGARRCSQREAGELAASGLYGAVVAGTAGRLALPLAWRGARRSGTPFVFWAAMWGHPRTPAHALSYPLLRAIYRGAAAVVTYGPHVSAYVRRHGARNVLEAPQAVDNDFWSAPVEVASRRRPRFLWVGRPAREKGLHVLQEAWRLAALDAELQVVGDGRFGRTAVGPAELRNFYAAADVLVVPSIRTPGFLEPWGLVVNEAMNQGTAIIASDAVGAAAGGLVRDGETGLVVPAGDAGALSRAMARLAKDEGLRARLAAGGRQAVAAYTPQAWAAGFARALKPLLAS